MCGFVVAGRNTMTGGTVLLSMAHELNRSNPPI